LRLFKSYAEPIEIKNIDMNANVMNHFI